MRSSNPSLLPSWRSPKQLRVSFSEKPPLPPLPPGPKGEGVQRIAPSIEGFCGRIRAMDKPSSTAARDARIVRASAASGKVAPLYASTRLLRGAVVDAEQSVVKAHEARDKALAEAAAIRQKAINE